MSDDSIATLMSRNFVLVPANTTVKEIRASVPLGSVAVVMQGNFPIGVLTEDRLLGLEDPQRLLAHCAARFYTPTLTRPATPLYDILQGMSYGPSVRWHVVLDRGEVLGVVDPNVLFVLLPDWKQRPPAWLSEAMQTLLEQWGTLTLGTLLTLPGNPIHPEPKICGVCPATDPPHPLAPRDLDYADPLHPTCKTHQGTAIAWLNPCA